MYPKSIRTTTFHIHRGGRGEDGVDYIGGGGGGGMATLYHISEVFGAFGLDIKRLGQLLVRMQTTQGRKMIRLFLRSVTYAGGICDACLTLQLLPLSATHFFLCHAFMQMNLFNW